MYTRESELPDWYDDVEADSPSGEWTPADDLDYVAYLEATAQPYRPDDVEADPGFPFDPGPSPDPDKPPF